MNQNSFEQFITNEQPEIINNLDYHVTNLRLLICDTLRHHSPKNRYESLMLIELLQSASCLAELLVSVEEYLKSVESSS